MVKVGDLVDTADLPDTSKPRVKEALRVLGYEEDEKVGEAFTMLTCTQLTSAGLNVREANANLAKEAPPTGRSIWLSLYISQLQIQLNLQLCWCCTFGLVLQLQQPKSLLWLWYAAPAMDTAQAHFLLVNVVRLGRYKVSFKIFQLMLLLLSIVCQDSCRTLWYAASAPVVAF